MNLYTPMFAKTDYAEIAKVAGVNFASVAISYSNVEACFKLLALAAAAVYTTCKAIGAVIWVHHRLRRWWRGESLDITFKCPITGKDKCPMQLPDGPENSENDQ